MAKTEVCGGDFSTTIDRTKWGVNYLVDAGMTKTSASTSNSKPPNNKSLNNSKGL